MQTSLTTVRTDVTNSANFAVMRDQIQIGKTLVVAGGSGGTRNEAHGRTKVRPWTRVEACREFCGLQASTGTRHACHRRMSREERERLQPLEHGRRPRRGAQRSQKSGNSPGSRPRRCRLGKG